MGCSCGNKKSGIRYEVSFADGSKQTYESVSAAQKAGTATAKPYTFKAVPA